LVTVIVMGATKPTLDAQNQTVDERLLGVDCEIGSAARHVLGISGLDREKAADQENVLIHDGDSRLGSFAHRVRGGAARGQANGDGREVEIDERFW